MKKMLPAVLLTVLTLTAISSHAQFIDKRLRKGGFGIKAGIIGGSSYTFESGDDVSQKFRNRPLDSKISLSGGVFFEFSLAWRLMLGIHADLHNVILNELEDNEPFFDIGIGPKYAFISYESDLAIKPGFAVGLGYLGPLGRLPRSEELGHRHAIARTSYMTWRVFTEVLFLTHRRVAFVADLALIGTAMGSNSRTDVSTNPVLALRVGIMY